MQSKGVHVVALRWEDLIAVAREVEKRGRRGQRLRCVSRAGVARREHSFDKDGKCVFCDRDTHGHGGRQEGRL
jgi:hypothetical protein